MKFLRWWCSTFHGSIMFAGGRTYECRTCGRRFENPANDGPMSSRKSQAPMSKETRDGVILESVGAAR
jgi:hypothetical protein